MAERADASAVVGVAVRSVGRASVLAAATVLAALGGCTVGPRYVAPEPVLPERFDGATAGVATPEPVVPALWRAHGAPELDALIARALRANRDLAQAQARLAEARALRGLTLFGLLPTVTAAADRERSQPSREDPFLPAGQPATTVYRAGFDAAWELDVFGAARSAAATARAEAEAADAELRALQASIAAEVAQAWFALRAAQLRRDLLARNVANLRDQERILEVRLEAGRGTRLDLERARALRASVAASLPEATAETTRQEQRLAVLAVLPVAELRRDWLGSATALPELSSAVVAAGTPAEWLRRRPDVRAAEQRLAGETARVGIATADYFPRVTLLGGFGYTAQSRAGLFGADAERWRYGPAIDWSFLDVGRVRQRVIAAEARAAASLAVFDATVLRALEETENALAGYRAAGEALQALDEARAAGARALGLARARYEAGAADQLAVLDAERSLLDSELRRLDAALARATSLAAVTKALAGDVGGVPTGSAP
jgi:multidrug efflux system outer membrane protein